MPFLHIFVQSWNGNTFSSWKLAQIFNVFLAIPPKKACYYVLWDNLQLWNPQKGRFELLYTTGADPKISYIPRTARSKCCPGGEIGVPQTSSRNSTRLPQHQCQSGPRRPTAAPPGCTGDLPHTTPSTGQ
jgi:hypothetical protein